MSKVTTDFLVQQFRASGQKVPTIVYDVDDVLWDLIGRVAERYHIDREALTHVFKITDNEKLTPSQQETVINAFADPDIFREIQFYPGTSEILQPCELGAKVIINSNSFNQAIADLKREQLLAAVPGLRTENIHMNIVNYSGAHRKEFTPNMTILVEDSPHNVSMSPAIVNVMPMTVRWTWNAQTVHALTDKPVVWQTDLVSINQYVYDLVAAMMASD